MDISLILSIAALALAGLAAVRSYVPPQARNVWELAQRVGDLEESHEALSARTTKRAKQANMEKAQEAAAERRERRDSIEQQAAALIEAAAKPAQPQLALAGGTDVNAAKAALRKKIGIL